MAIRWKSFILVCLATALPTLLRAQEPWDTSLNLSVSRLGGAEKAYVGQDMNFGAAMAGVYPISRRGSLGFDFGYRWFPTTTRETSTDQVQERSEGFFATALYRWSLDWQETYVQGGVRTNQFRTFRTTTDLTSGDGTDIKSPRSSSTTPILGAGVRLNERISLELDASNLKLQNLDGKTKSGLLLEITMAIHH